MNQISLHKILFILTTLTCCFSALAQSQFKPVNLGINVNTQYAEFNPVISPDGKTLYFTRADHPQNTFGHRNTHDIWYTTLNNEGKWSKARHLPKSINIGRYNTILAVLEDGNTFLINGIYNKKGSHWKERGLSFIEKTDMEHWGIPVRLHIKGYGEMNKGNSTTAYMTPDKKLLFLAFSNKSNSNKQTIYLSKQIKENKYSRPVELTGEINDGWSNESPFLSPDGNLIYFSSSKKRTSDDYDILYCQRGDASFTEWRHPEKLSDTINTFGWDSYYKLNQKESWAYYSSVTNAIGKSDLFQVKIYEENPYIKLSGSVLNQVDQTPMISDTSYRITVNGERHPAVKIDKKSATYEIILPLGDQYTIRPELENWHGISADIDVSMVQEYTETEMNLYVTPVPFVQVKGKIMDTRTLLPVSLEKQPRVSINGMLSDSVIYDPYSASYQVLLPLDSTYVFQAEVQHFTGIPDTVDVKNIRSFQEKELDLYVTSDPWVEVNGVILDNSSFTPVTGNSQPKLYINDKPVDSINIDSTTAEFTVNLPFGKSYVFTVVSPDFNTLPNPLDLTGFVEYAAIPFHVYAEKKDANMAILNGKIINIKTGKPLEPDVDANIKVNGIVSSAFKYDSSKATYSLKLPVGYSYDLMPSVRNFYNKYEQLDLTRTAPMTEINKDFYVTPIEVGQAVDIEYVYFEVGKTELKPESFRSLNALISFLNEYPTVRVEIGGHTDNTGSADHNMKLSERRAQSVVDYLIASGIDASRIQSKGYGLTKPKFSNKTASGRAKNRRVEFTITGT